MGEIARPGSLVHRKHVMSRALLPPPGYVFEPFGTSLFEVVPAGSRERYDVIGDSPLSPFRGPSDTLAHPQSQIRGLHPEVLGRVRGGELSSADAMERRRAADIMRGIPFTAPIAAGVEGRRASGLDWGSLAVDIATTAVPFLIALRGRVRAPMGPLSVAARLPQRRSALRQMHVSLGSSTAGEAVPDTGWSLWVGTYRAAGGREFQVSIGMRRGSGIAHVENLTSSATGKGSLREIVNELAEDLRGIGATDVDWTPAWGAYGGKTTSSAARERMFSRLRHRVLGSDVPIRPQPEGPAGKSLRAARLAGDLDARDFVLAEDLAEPGFVLARDLEGLPVQAPLPPPGSISSAERAALLRASIGQRVRELRGSMVPPTPWLDASGQLHIEP